MTTKVTGSILANTAVSAGRYGGATSVGTFTVDAQGRLIDSGNTTIAITSSNLDATGVTGTTYGGGVSSANFQLPVVTVDTKGRITAASNVTVTSTAIYTNTGQLTANAATGVVQIGLATSGANPGNYGSGTTTPVITVDSLGRITSVSSVLITGGSAGTGSTTFNRTTVTASAGQTLFSSIPHTTGYLQVHVNGVLMTPNDYTANSSNSSVVLTQACSVGDQVDVFAYTTTLANNLSPGTTGGSAGVILYQSAANTTSNTIVGTSGQVLTSAGTGQPTWTTLASSATTDTTNASNITSGTLPNARHSTLYTPVGVSQTWSLPTRAAATTYTNSTGRPIVVAISLFYNGQNGGGSATVTVDSVVIQQSQGNNVSGASSAPVHTFIVPNGSTYLLTTTNNGGGAPAVNRWAELA